MAERAADTDRERNQHGQYADRIPARAALEVFEQRSDPARPLTAGDVMDALECSRRTAHNKLNELVDQGVLETRKVGARGRVWWIPMDTEEPQEPRDQSTREAVRNARQQSTREAVREADLPGTGETLQRRQEALLAAYDYLSENPSAKKSDFQKEVFPENPAGYETADGWWNAIHPALKDLPGVEPPDEREHVWHFLGG